LWEKGANAQKYLLETNATEFLADISIASMRRTYASIKKDRYKNPFREAGHNYCDEEMKLMGSAIQSHRARKMSKKSHGWTGRRRLQDRL
jgi:hypothetical protein